MQINLASYWKDEPPSEGLVFSFLEDTSESSWILTYEFVAESLSRHFQGLPSKRCRDFRKLTLADARLLSATSFKNSDTAVSLELLQKKIPDSPICIISYSLQSHESLSVLDIEFTNCFNARLSFARANAERRLAASTQIGDDEWSYHDIETGEEIEFYRPFDAGGQTGTTIQSHFLKDQR